MIRKAVYSDIEAINKLGEIFKQNFSKTYSIKEYLNNENYIILVHKNIIINAFIIIYKNLDYFEIEAIIVSPESRKQGIANSLMNFFINNYASCGDTILLEVAVNNEPAINLYKKYNFETINIRKKYYNNLDAYVMKKVIE